MSHTLILHPLEPLMALDPLPRPALPLRAIHTWHSLYGIRWVLQMWLVVYSATLSRGKKFPFFLCQQNPIWFFCSLNVSSTPQGGA